MTVESLQTKEIYEGNGAATEFPVPFSYNQTDTLKLIFTSAAGEDVEVTENFRVNVSGDGDTSITYPLEGDPIPAGTRLTIYRQTPLTQIVDLIYGGAFTPDVLEHDALDRITMMVQELAERTERSLQWPITTDQDDMESPGEYLAQVNAARDVAVSAASDSAISAGASGASASAASQSAAEAEATANNLANLVPQEPGEAGDVLTKGDNGKANWTKQDGIPLLAWLWEPSSLDKFGFLRANVFHGLLPRAPFDKAAAEIQRRYDAGDTAVVADAVWMAEYNANGVCNRFSIGDGTLDEYGEPANFRIPYTPGLYPSAAAPDKGQSAGDYLSYGMPALTGEFSQKARIDVASGVFSRRSGTGYDFNQTASTAGHNGVVIDTSSVIPVADVLRPNTAVMTPFIKMYGAVTEAGEANLAALVALTTALNGRVYLVDSWRSADGTSWYRKYSDGWIEQGGNLAANTGTVNLLLPFLDADYSIIFGNTATAYSGAAIVQCYVNRNAKTETSFGVVAQGYIGGTTTHFANWIAYGQGAI